MFFSFTQNLRGFFKRWWRDLLALAVIGGATSGIWSMPRSFDRVFPLTFSGSEDILWTELAYPYQRPTFTSLTATIVAIAIPTILILSTQSYIGSSCNSIFAILGLTYSLLTGTFISVVLKKTIGGFRPYFLSVCEPRRLPQMSGRGYKNIMFTIAEVCTAKDTGKIATATESFPSGHSEFAFAGLFYLSIYLFAHLKVQDRRPCEYWRMVVCVLPTLLATYIACSVVLDYHHHAHDALFGSLLGLVVALFGYRMAFRSICDSKLNSTPSCQSDCREHGKPREGSLPT